MQTTHLLSKQTLLLILLEFLLAVFCLLQRMRPNLWRCAVVPTKGHVNVRSDLLELDARGLCNGRMSKENISQDERIERGHIVFTKERAIRMPPYLRARLLGHNRIVPQKNLLE